MRETKRAKCAGLDPALFMSTEPAASIEATAICNGEDGTGEVCPMRTECLNIRTSKYDGTWGGKTFKYGYQIAYTPGRRKPRRVLDVVSEPQRS